MDEQNITFVNGLNKFNLRVAILIENNNRFLLETAGDFWNMIGGRVHLGESTLEAAKRELKEELNFDADDLTLINVSENFFSWMGKNQQELLFVYKIIVDDSVAFAKQEELKCIDSDEIFKWHTREQVQNLVCKPEIIKHLVVQKDYISHSVEK